LPQIAQARGMKVGSFGESCARVGAIVSRCDGAALLRVIEAAAARLEREVAQVDALNVYPLPDGDTGRNMLRTMRAALARAHDVDGSASAVSAALARGALMGARGNSGVILSQILAGLGDALAEKDDLGASELRDAIAGGRRKAYAAVDRPAEGTILSLCAEVADALPANVDLPAILRAAVEVGAEALGRTMQENPMNRAAGVVDAGAYGLWLLLAGALCAVEGEAARIPEPALRRPGTEASIIAAAPTEVASWTGGHCVEYLVPSPRRPPEELRKEMLALGADSVLVVGDETMLKVHAHAARPEAVIAIGASAGAVEDLVVSDLDEMVAEHERTSGIVLRSPPRPLAAIAVVPGEGFADIARSLYATPLRGGATMNPSVGEILEAIRGANARAVVVLPNDRNVVLAAREAAKLAEGIRVEVIETRSVAQGLAALVEFDPMKDAESVLERMREASAEAHGIEVTRATRAATMDGIEVREGDEIALLDGRLVARGSDPVEVLADAAGRLEDVGIVTLYVGANVDAGQAERAAQRLRATLPDAEVEVRHGGQPHYPFIVQAE